MKLKITIFLFYILLFDSSAVLCKDASPVLNLPTGGSFLTLNEIINKVEDRYAVSGFSALFDQVSTLKALEITDTAQGKVFIKSPGMMRWEYEKPDKQTIITDGKILWVYRPEDNHVMRGESPSFLGGGKGASFLTDMKRVRQEFSITLDKKNNDDYVLKMLPGKEIIDLSVIYLSISKKTFDVVKIVTHNSYGDETIIKLSDIKMLQNIEDSKFCFTVPEGIEILKLE